MGLILHDTIVATSWDEKTAQKACDKAKELELPVSNVVASPINGYFSFFVAPDGSKEGWADSEKGEQAREELLSWIRSQERFYIDFALVRFGGDYSEDATVRDHN